DLTQALVEDGSVDISPYSFNTGDKRRSNTSLRGYLNESDWEEENWTEARERVHKALVKAYERGGGEIYSDKAPFSSVLAVPGYIIGDSVGKILKQRNGVWIDNPLSTKDIPVHLSLETVMEQIMIAFTVPVLLGAFLMVLLYRMIRKKLEEKVAVYTVGIAGLGTLLFYYSTAFYGVIAATTLGFASYYLMERYLEEGKRRFLILAGILGGLAITTEYYVVLVPLALTIYLFYRRGITDLGVFLSSVIIGVIPMFIYNIATSGNPFLPVFFSGYCNFYPFCFEGTGILSYTVSNMTPVNTGIRLLFYPVKGILFLSPVLLLSLPGAYRIYNRDKKFLIVAPGIFILFFLFNSFWPTWMAGWTFGPRYLVPGIPFLMFAVAYGIETVLEGEKWKQVLVLVLFAVSFLHMIAAFQVLPYKDITPETYEERYTSMEPIWPDFYEEKMTDFFQYGPRSELMMSFMDREKGLDITYRSPRGPGHLTVDSGGTFLKVDVAFLPLLLLIMIMGAFWAWDKRIVIALAVFSLILLAGSTSTTNHVYGDGFTSNYQDPGRPWMSSKGSISFNIQNTTRVPVLTIHPDPNLNNNGSVRLYLNGEEIGKFYIEETQTLSLIDAHVRRGVNTLTINSTWGCRSRPNASAPFPVTSAYNQCISYQITNFTLKLPPRFPEELYQSGFYHNFRNPGRPWMGDKATINVSLPDEMNRSSRKVLRMDVYPHPQINYRRLKISMDENKSMEVDVSRRRTIYLPVGRGEISQIRLESQDKCDARIHSSREGECLSYSIGNITIFPISALPQKTFYWDWFPPSPAGDYRWMGKHGKLVVVNRGGGKTFSAYARPYPGIVPARLELLVGNREGVRRRNITFEKVRWKHITTSKLVSGINYVNLLSRSGCEIPAEVEDSSDDTRCLSFRIKNITIS
ncbi:MAG: glycosyltransferase family 39 protein, partial [Candidatus Nanohaloarchaea archaeon]